MFDQLANALAPNFFRTKRPRRIAQQRLTHTGILILIFLPFSPSALQDAGDTFSRSVAFFSRQGTLGPQGFASNLRAIRSRSHADDRQKLSILLVGKTLGARRDRVRVDAVAAVVRC
jgi:hypothetical protein